MKKELELLQGVMRENGVAICIVPTNDFHGSEYINEYFRSRQFISGFTGSAGTLVVCEDSAYLWTDGRYFLQASLQLKESGIELMKTGEPGVPEIGEFLEKNLKQGDVLAFDGRVLACRIGDKYKQIADKCGAITKFDLDLPGLVWTERPKLLGNSIWALPETSYGETFEEKLARVREAMTKSSVNYHLITGLEENAWLYNLRGSDVDRSPIFFSFTLITPDSITLYKFGDDFDDLLKEKDVTVKSYLDIFEDIKLLPNEAAVLADFDAASYSLIKSIPAPCKIVDGISPASVFKSVKNHMEIAATKEAHMYDGIAMVNFIYWLKNTVSKQSLTEISASDHLESLRRAQPGFIDLSFDTIAGYMSNGAIIHYSATPESDTALEANGFILVDSGGQYLKGTTDITRTIALGALTDKMKEYYTAVLRGHLDLAMAKFKAGTTGCDLDYLARKALHEIGLDYNHGTGHGVGHVLSVHEGPQRISKLPSKYDFKSGMITSDEPGVYIEGEFGIRIENEILCKEADGNADELYFEMLTLCPYEPEAIISERLTEEERSYLNGYHKMVYSKLAPLLEPEVRNWLRKVTAPL